MYAWPLLFESGNLMPQPTTFVQVGQVAPRATYSPAVPLATLTVLVTYWTGPRTACFLNFLVVRKPPPATAVPVKAATSAMTAMIAAGLGRRRSTFFIGPPFIRLVPPPAPPDERPPQAPADSIRDYPGPPLKCKRPRSAPRQRPRLI